MQKELNDLILVPVDFSEISENAVAHACHLAENLGYSVHLTHVINRDTKTMMRRTEQEKSDILEKLDNLGEKYATPLKVSYNFSSLEGSIFNEIEITLLEKGAKLMVMGTHGKKGLQHLFGSYALKVVTKSPVPVIVVQERDFGQGYNNIVFPVNDFTETRQQVQWAAHIAKRYDSKIHLFVQKESDAGLETKISLVTRQIIEAFEAQEIDYTLFESGKVANYTDQLLEFAAEKRADLITLMTDSDAYSPDFPISSWDEKLMFNPMQIPVMCINPKELNQVYYRYVGIL